MASNVRNILGRITWFYLLALFLSLCIVAKIIWLQFFTDLKTKADDIAVKQVSIEASRGNIYANDDRMLATSLPYYEIRMDFAAAGLKDSTFNKNVGKLAESLANLYGNRNASEYKKFLQNSYKNKSKHRYERLGNRNIDFIELQKLKKFPILKLGANKGGLIIVEKTQRKNPYGSLAFRTIGWVNSEDRAAVGIEGAFNEYLQGKKGAQLVQRIAGSSWMPINSEYNKDPEDGYDVVSTLDIDIQEVAENALRNQLKEQSSVEGGTAIVMEVKSGEIRAIANMRRNANGGYSESYNYAIREVSPPGSTFKLATLIALLDDDKVSLNTIVETQPLWEYKSHKFREAGGHNYGTIPVKKVFAKSSNVGFAKLAVKYYSANPQKFFDKLQSFGIFNDTLNLQIEGEGKARMTLPSSKIWQPQLLPLSAIGYQVMVAPIHTLMLYNAVANNGKMMKPKFIKEIRKHGQTIKEFPDEVLVNEICSQKTIKDVRSALEGVIDSGTAKFLKDLPFKSAGKTGTAQRVISVNGKARFHDSQGRTAYQATFAAFFPAEEPRYTVVVVLYSAPIAGNFYGATWAGPVFKEIASKVYSSETELEGVFDKKEKLASFPVGKNGKTKAFDNIIDNLDIPADESAKGDWAKVWADSTKVKVAELNVTENKVPSVVNMGLKDAVYLLENMGLNVSFSGKGSIKSQSLAAGTAVQKGQNIYLELN